MKDLASIKILSFILLMIFMANASAQDTRQFERRSSEEDQMILFDPDPESNEGSYEERENEWADLLIHPVGINSEADLQLLASLNLISNYQLNKLNEYRYIFGDLLSLYELLYIDGWDESTVRSLMPCVFIDKNNLSGRKSKKVSQEIFLTFKTTAEKAFGNKSGKNTRDSSSPTLSQPYYSGLRYDLELGKKIRVGFRMEKDAYEPLLSKNPGNGGMSIPMTDYYSGYFQIRDFKFIKSLCIGDFQLKFGQGLSLWSSQLFSRDPFSSIIYPGGLKPHTSMNECRFLRGAAINTMYKNISIGLFFSRNKLDPSGTVTDSLGGKLLTFSGFSQSGYHRMETEINNKHLLIETLWGSYITYQNRHFRIGLIGLKGKYNSMRNPEGPVYTNYRFNGNSYMTLGIEYLLHLGRMTLSGEVSRSHNGGLAGQSSMEWILHPALRLSLFICNYGKDYQNPQNSSGPDGASNLKSIRLGISTSFPGKIDLKAGADYTKKPWLSYGLDAPDREVSIYLIARKRINYWTYLEISWKSRRSDVNIPSEFTYTSPTDFESRNSLRLRLITTPSTKIQCKTQLDFIRLKTPAVESHNGLALIQDIKFSFRSDKLSAWCRLSIFDTDDFSARIYVYENSMPYSYTSASYYYQGARTCLLLTWKPAVFLQAWLKLGYTKYFNRDKIGSGLNEIDGNHKTDLELQLRISL